MRTQGTDTRKCMSDGTWSGQDLKCKGEILQKIIYLTLFTSFFAHQIGISGILSWDRKSYPCYLKHAVTSALSFGCNGTHTHGRQVTSVLSQSDVSM